MKLHWISSLLVGALVCVVSQDRAQGEQKELFTGKDLTGWTGRKDLWSVEDGAITGRTTDEKPIHTNTFLYWKDGTLKDFTLTLKYRIVGGNSGIQYRSKVEEETEEHGPVVKGYQADMEAGENYSGILYEERGRGILAMRGQKVVIEADENNANQHKVTQVGSTEDSDKIQAAIKSEDWNEYRIVAKGNHLQHYINGHLTVDVEDKHAAGAAEEGILAFQLHVGPAMTVQFKDIVLETEDEPAKKKAKE